MSTPGTPEYDEDQVKQVEFIRSTLLRYSDSQDTQYGKLHSKITFLFGFIVAVLTLYGTYATHTNIIARYTALGFLAVALILLCIAIQNRQYVRAPMLDSEHLDQTTYFSQVYQDVVDIEKICADNKLPLQALERWVKRSIWAFTTAMIALALSFIVPRSFMLHSKHDVNPSRATITTKTDLQAR